MSEPRHFHNDLQPVPLDDTNLSNTLASLQAAIGKSVQLLLEYMRINTDRPSSRDSLYTGDPGIALTFLRFAVQFNAAGLGDSLAKDVQVQCPVIINALLPKLKASKVRPGHLSPLDSPVGSALVYILASLHFPAASLEEEVSTSSRKHGDGSWTAAVQTLQNAVTCAVEDCTLGGDEVLYGRAGLLWGMLNLLPWIDADKPSQKREDITGIVNTQSIERVIKRIMEAGELGAEACKQYYGETSLPLLWPWHDKVYLGAIHGVAGILTVILQAPRELITPYMQTISQCISALCTITRRNGGHLPSSLPEKQRIYNYVQICHGSPGFLILLALFRARFPNEWKMEWDAVETLAAEKVWKEGLVRKGIGICHGITGNAWPLLLSARSHKGTAEGDTALSYSLAFLLKATELPPLDSGKTSPFRTPDHPLSLFEGLGGAVCAWVDACVSIRERLGIAEGKKEKLYLGFPGIGGARVHGYL